MQIAYAAGRPNRGMATSTSFGNAGKREKGTSMSYGSVADPAASTWRTIVFITSTFPSGATFAASGVMVGPNDVLTAAHAVYIASQGGAATSVTVTPAHGALDPYGTVTSASYHYFPDYDADGDGLLSAGNNGPGLVGSELDIALIDLPTNLGDQTGWMQINGSFSSGAVNVTGYPSMYGSSMMNNIVDAYASNVDSLVIYPGAQLYPGNSGGPVWYVGRDGGEVVGVVSTASWAAGVSGMHGQLSQWIAANDASSGGSTPLAAGNGLSPGNDVGLTRDPTPEFGSSTVQVGGAFGFVAGTPRVDTASFPDARAAYDVVYSRGDVVVTDISSGAVHVLSQIEHVRFADAFLLTHAAPAQVDFGMGRGSEVLFHNLGTGEVSLWGVHGTAVSFSQTVASAGPEWTIGGEGDFNGDGRSDILWRDDDGTLATWEMSGYTLLAGSTVQQVSNDWSVVGTGNFNTDAYDDILWRNANGQVGLWEMKGSSFLAASVVHTVPTDWQIVGAADFNGDAKTDILWRNDNGELGVWEMYGSTIAGATVVQDAPMSQWIIAGMGDFNGDGRTDILWRDGSDQLTIWNMDGGHHTTVGMLEKVAADMTVVGIGDFDANGTADILFQDSANRLAVHLVNGFDVVGAGTLGTMTSDWIVA